MKLILGDCLEVLKALPDGCVDAVVTDPPYPEIDREYGRWTEAEWWDLMMGVCAEVRRVLKPTGSAAFVLQANSRKVGSMRGWLWRFMAWVCEHWNMIQDAWWWNPSAPPTVHTHRDRGLMRPSLKAVVWCGPPDCYRGQDEVLLEAAEATLSDKRIDRMELHRHPSGQSVRHGRALAAFRDRGGVTPFNLLVCSNGDSQTSAGAHGHGAGTPMALCRWWTRYICPPGGVVLDPFTGSGTTGLACVAEHRDFIGVELNPDYFAVAKRRIEEAEACRDGRGVGELFANAGGPQ
jgi:DNA modification methylase